MRHLPSASQRRGFGEAFPYFVNSISKCFMLLFEAIFVRKRWSHCNQITSTPIGSISVDFPSADIGVGLLLDVFDVCK